MDRPEFIQETEETKMTQSIKDYFDIVEGDYWRETINVTYIYPKNYDTLEKYSKSVKDMIRTKFDPLEEIEYYENAGFPPYEDCDKFLKIFLEIMVNHKELDLNIEHSYHTMAL